MVAVMKFSRPVRKLRDTRARAAKLFTDLEMPSAKQVEMDGVWLMVLVRVVLDVITAGV